MSNKDAIPSPPGSPPPKAKKRSRTVPSVDDPTAAFPIGVLAGLIEEDVSEEATPGGKREKGGSAATARTPAPADTGGLQLRLLGISLLLGAGAATLVALIFAAAMLVVGR